MLWFTRCHTYNYDVIEIPIITVILAVTVIPIIVRYKISIVPPLSSTSNKIQNLWLTIHYVIKTSKQTAKVHKCEALKEKRIFYWFSNHSNITISNE